MKISSIYSFAALVAILFSLSQCKSPVAPADVVVNTTTDTTALPDTTSIAKAASDTVATRAPLTLVISNLASPTAPVIVGVYGTKNKFPYPKDQLKVYTFKPDSVLLTAMITDLPFGTYALAIYQDVNSNGKIDKNLIGIPTEPYAFSNNYKPTVKAPAFKNCQFEYNTSSNTMAMKMTK
jgi:uncharacterized protein (DUF2141 family)